MREPAKGSIALIFQALPTHTGHCTVLHHEEPRAHCTSVWFDSRSEDFIMVPTSSQGTFGYDMEVCTTLQGYAPPDPPLNRSCGMKTPDVSRLCTPVTCAQHEPALVPKWPANSGVPLQMPVEVPVSTGPTGEHGPPCHPHAV